MTAIAVGAVVVLDADVLHRANVRDVLLRVARRSLFEPHWTSDILDELTRSLQGRGVTAPQTQRLTDAMNRSFPTALVTGHRRHVGRIILPDPDDRHVVAAAITAKASHVVTYNLSDFPHAALTALDIEAIHPDRLLTTLIGLDPASVLDAIDELLSHLRKPPIPLGTFIESLKTQGLNTFCTALEAARRAR